MAPSHSTGWKGPIIKPERSAAAERLAMGLSAAYPPEVRLPGARAILDQQKVDCCISCAIATCVEVLHPHYEQLSPLFHYFENSMRFVGRPPAVDDGMEASQGFATLANVGISLLSLHNVPFDANGVEREPSSSAVADGLRRTMPYDGNRFANGYEEIELILDPVNNMKSVLAGGRPILAAIQLTSNYGAVRLDEPGAPTGGRHAIAILGYSNSEAAFIAQDSRGANWASGGQWWLPFSIVVSPESIVLQAFAVGYPN